MDYVAKIYNYTEAIKAIANSEELEMAIDVNRHIVIAVEDAQDLLDSSEFEIIDWTAPLNLGIPRPRKR